VLVIAAVIPVAGLVIGFAELKLSAKMQNRVGPYFAGGRWGWAQLLADGIKFFQKEDLVPTEADRPVFKFGSDAGVHQHRGAVRGDPLRPHPGGPRPRRRHLLRPRHQLVSTIGVLVAGWSSANKYSLMGGLRAAGQLIAYELPLVLSWWAW
jgi:NADH-quinone oxidoreductase subunit H